MSAQAAKRTASQLEAWLDAFIRDPAFLEAYPYYAAILAKLTPVADPSVARMAVSLYDGRFFLHVNVDAFTATVGGTGGGAPERRRSRQRRR